MEIGQKVYFYDKETQTIKNGEIFGINISKSGYVIVSINTDSGKKRVESSLVSGEDIFDKNKLDALSKKIIEKSDEFDKILEELRESFKAQLKEKTDGLLKEIDELRLQIIGEPPYKPETEPEERVENGESQEC